MSTPPNGHWAKKSPAKISREHRSSRLSPVPPLAASALWMLVLAAVCALLGVPVEKSVLWCLVSPAILFVLLYTLQYMLGLRMILDLVSGTLTGHPAETRVFICLRCNEGKLSSDGKCEECGSPLWQSEHCEWVWESPPGHRP